MMRISRIGAALLLLLPAQIAFSQEPGAVLEEVVVTARKREESLQDAPISISVFSERDLAARGAQTLADIDSFTPNLRFNYTAPISANSATAAIFIRGIGQNDFQMSADPGVGLYLDGVYISRAVGSVLDTVEVERIEILRGPQGTLFGRNTIGGAINVISRKPHDEFAAYVEAEAGTDELLGGRAHLNLPLAQRVYAAATVNYRSREAYVDNVGDGPDLGDEDRLSGRVTLRFEPTDELAIELSADGTRIREGSAPFVLVEQYEHGLIPTLWNLLFSDDPAECLDPSNSARLQNPTCASPRWALGKGRTAATFATSDPASPFNSLSESGRPYESAGDIDVSGFAATLDWGVGRTLAVKSITAYREVEGFWTRDNDHSPLDMIGTVNDWDQDQFSQELQLAGTGFEERLRWVIGGYYASENGVHNDFGMIWASNLLFKSGADIDASSLAFFGQGVYALSPTLDLTVGMRWTRDRKTFQGDQYIIQDNVIGFPPGTPLIPHESLTIEDEAWTPSISLAYAASDAWNLYLSYSEGFKGGGFTQRVFPPLSFIPSFKPEEAQAYEIGVKFMGLDNRVRFNFAAFRTDYQDMQLLGQEPTLGFAPIIFNAAESTIQGIEAEFSAIPADDWLLQGGIGYLDAEYDEISEFAQSVGVDTTKEFMNAPKVTANSAVSYEYRRSGAGILTSRLDWSYTSKIYNDVTNAEVITQTAYHLLGISLSWESDDRLWAVRLAGLNLTDEQYKDSGNFDPGGGIAEVVFTRGREVRLSVRRNF